MSECCGKKKKKSQGGMNEKAVTVQLLRIINTAYNTAASVCSVDWLPHFVEEQAYKEVHSHPLHNLHRVG